MKKAILILLVLLTVSVVYGAYTPAGPPTPTSVNITTSNNGVLSHKITAAAVTTSTGFDGAAAVATKPVSISSTTAQSVGFYALKTNTKKTVAITVTADALHTTTPAYYIPYTLTVGSTSGNFGSYVASTTVPSTTPSITLNATSINTYSTGMRILSQEIKVTFGQNYTESALEGDYISTITFTVTAN